MRAPGTRNVANQAASSVRQVLHFALLDTRGALLAGDLPRDLLARLAQATPGVLLHGGNIVEVQPLTFGDLDRTTYAVLVTGAARAPRSTKAVDRVADLVRLGHGNQAIARELGISVNGVRFHLKKLYARTKARSRHELVRLLLLAPSPLVVNSNKAHRRLR